MRASLTKSTSKDFMRNQIAVRPKISPANVCTTSVGLLSLDETREMQDLEFFGSSGWGAATGGIVVLT
jgi:hypothetical protein